ncbi:hypothetical protein [Streptomyces somaliensis]|uniref:hypothetical protein n=1 Tax=Streptomyces somaliensis TaxID=78355 RepID=UPI003F74CE3E
MAVTMRFQYSFHASGSGPHRWLYVDPFISQPRTTTVSGTPSPTSRCASARKCRSYRPSAPARSIRRTAASGSRLSLSSSIGTLRTNIRSAPARRHRAQSSRKPTCPEMLDQRSPGR